MADDPGQGSLADYLDDCRREVLDEIRSRIPRDGRHTGRLYELMLEYPLRPAKVLRPSLAIAMCRLAGGSLASILPSAAALELYHNAFLIHDDVEDGSELRRGGPTLHRAYGIPVAVNVGDGMLALAMRTLADNTRALGLSRCLAILDAVGEMAVESAEGQAMELAWIADGTWALHDRDYLRMVYKKSTFYSFVTPIRVGAIAAGLDERERTAWERFGALLGTAFQIQDDVLNLAGSEAAYGKEIAGDLLEGKRTTIVLHALRHASTEDRAAAIRALNRPRPERTAEDVHFVSTLVHRAGSLEHARSLASRHCVRAARLYRRLSASHRPSAHRDFLGSLVHYVLQRDR